MPAAKPCLGYPSRSAAAFALQKTGLTARQVGERIGVSAACAAALINSAAKTRDRQYGCTRAIAFNRDTLRLLRTSAVRRGVSVGDLARRIIEIVAKQDLVDAVLDDRAAQ